MAIFPTNFAAFICLLLVIACSSLFSQTESNVVVLNHADSLLGLELDGEPARQLIGSVKFTHGRVVVTCDRAIEYRKSKKIVLEGNIVVREDTLTLKSKQGIYYPDSRIAEAHGDVELNDGKALLKASYGKYFIEERKAYFRGNVSVEDSTTRLFADELTHYREKGETTADGNVRVSDTTNSIIIFGGHFENYRKKNYSVMTVNPKAIQIDTADDGTIDTLTVTSTLMESYQDSMPRLIAAEDVVITSADLAGEAGLLTFYTDLDSIVMLQKPFVWYSTNSWETTQTSGDSMFVKLRQRQIETVYIRGHAVALSVADSLHQRKFNQLSGQEIIMRFMDKKISQIDVNHTATMVYYLFEGDKPNGLNKTTGDYVMMRFKDGRLEKITVSGGIEGQYVPERLVVGRESEYNLPGFNWRENRPGRILETKESESY